MCSVWCYQEVEKLKGGAYRELLSRSLRVYRLECEMSPTGSRIGTLGSP